MKRILLTPGPVTTTESVKKSMLVPDICPRVEEFSKIITSIRRDLVKLAGGNDKYASVLFNSSGTGAMEACMSSILPVVGYTSATEKTALILSNGVYGQRFSNIANSLNMHSYTLEQKWGTRLDIARFKNIIDDTIGAVFVTHHETSTGILNSLDEISKATKEFGIPLVVDCISSFGSMPINIQKMGADFVIGTSNKGLQGVPGISYVICKGDSMNISAWNSRSFYFNIGLEYESQEINKQFRFTAPTQVLLALRQAIDELLKEGIKNRYARYCKNYKILVKGMHDRGFESYLSDDIPRSMLLETFIYPDKFNFNAFHKKLYKRGFTIYPGVLEEDTFRLGCTGDLSSKDINHFLKAVDEIW